MYPAIATVICILFIAWLFWADSRVGGEYTSALWIPFLWMFFAGSRYAAAWLGVGQGMSSADAYSDGSPLDRAVFGALIAAGVLVLARRKIDWVRLLRQNKVLVLYFLYALSSMAWADDSFLLFKRWTKDLGNPIMALVLLTEPRPYESIGVLLKRLAFVMLPLSILFIRYYPELGRGYHNDGSPMYTGIGTQKNSLGLICLIAGIYFSWKYLQVFPTVKFVQRIRLVDCLAIAMLVYLLNLSNSQTSLACLLAVVVVLMLGRLPFIASKPPRIIPALVFAGLLFWVLDSTLDVYNIALELLGRNPNLTNRTALWDVLRQHEGSPAVGVGFMSFWSGARMEQIWDATGAIGLNQAHNGYLEQYLNLGYIGVALVVLVMVVGLLNVRRHLDIDPPAAMLRLCFILTAALYNYTEASFYGLNNIWVLLLVGVMDVADWRKASARARAVAGHYAGPPPQRSS